MTRCPASHPVIVVDRALELALRERPQVLGALQSEQVPLRMVALILIYVAPGRVIHLLEQVPSAPPGPFFFVYSHRVSPRIGVADRLFFAVPGEG